MTATTDLPTLSGRYELIEEIGRGAMGTVFRARDRITDQEVALKRVLVATTALDFAHGSSASDLNMALAGEFGTLASLRHPHIVNVIDYGFDDQGSPYFTMALIPDALDLVSASQGADLDRKLRYLSQVAQALKYLHRRQVLHRDIKPANVAVVDGQARLLDFGLAVTPDRTSETSGSGWGSAPYVAPEVWRGSPPSEATDLYAVGVMAYEILVGHNPFDVSSAATLFAEVFDKQPDLAPVRALDLPGEGARRLAEMVGRLLAKDPDLRPSARELLDFLEELSGTPSAGSDEIRESFLQAARFVGRDTELAQLEHALAEAIAGRGGGWLIGGESGVGKTRLCSELRTRALVRGAMVMTGQAVAKGVRPYQAWRGILAPLLSATQPTVAEAAALKPYVDDIERITGLALTSEPPADPKDAQRQLFATVTALLQRCQAPVLLVLEDVQWAGSDSLALLAHVLGQADQDSVLVVASYRSDEKPDLPQALPAARCMELQRLEPAAVAKLSESMLGPAGRSPQIVDFLVRESEGNVFFVTEIVRSLAERAGDLDEVGALSELESVLSGGIQAIVERRLDQVPAWARPALELAAVGARKLDLAALGQAFVDLDLERWLVACDEAAVLAVQDQAWAFSHDKIREGLRARLDDARAAGLHGQLAQAVEATAADPTARAAELAYHWNRAGRPDKEMPYTLAAADQAMAANAMVEAAGLYSRALEILLMGPHSPERDMHELGLQLRLGGQLVNTRGFAAPEVSQTFGRARELCAVVSTETPFLIPATWGLWNFYTVKGELGTALDLAQQIEPLAAAAGQQPLVRLGRLLVADTRFWMGQLPGLEAPMQDFLDHSDRERDITFAMAPTEDPQVNALSYAAWLHWLRGFPDRAAALSDRCIALARELGRMDTLAYAVGFAAWYSHYRRDYDRARDLAAEMIQLGVDYGLPYWLAAGQILHGGYTALAGEHEAGMTSLNTGLAIWRATGAVLFKPSFLYVQAWALAQVGQLDQAMEILDEAAAAIETTGERINEAEVHRFIGELARARGDLDKARHHYQHGLAVAREQGARSFELRCALAQAAQLAREGRRADAVDLVAPLLASFREGAGSPDHQDARKLLAALGAG